MIRHTLKLVVAALACASLTLAVTPVVHKKPAAKSAGNKKRYQSSIGKPVPGQKKSPVKRAVVATAHAIRKVIPKGPPVSAKTRAEAHDGVFQKVAKSAAIP